MPDAPTPVHPGPTAGGDGPLTEQILADFRDWLAADGRPDSAPLDLLAVVREFTALRHDVQLQTKATRAAVDKLAAPVDAREFQRPLVAAMVDIADALRTARDAARAAVVPRPGRLRRWLAADTTARLAAVADGYELSQRRAERALAEAGLTPVPAVGERFDPETMEAVGLADGPASGFVLAESRRGYRWHGQLFRPARVTVAR